MRRTLTLTLFLTLVAFSANAQARRRAVSTPTPKVDFAAAISIQIVDEQYVVYGHVFTYLPIGSKIQRQVWNPNGTLHYADTGDKGLINVPGAPWLVSWKFIPPGWERGGTLLKMFITLYGKEYIVTAELPGSVLAQGEQSKAVVDASGGIMLLGVFKTLPVVVSPNWMNQQIPLMGGNYIPPRTLPAGKKTITWCSGIGGDAANLECTSQAVTLPEQ